MTPHVRVKIRNRNCLRQTIHQNHQEWIDPCRGATETINEVKTESWRNLLQDGMSSSDGPNMWKTIQGLNATPDANSLNKAMSHNGRTITDIKSKASVFINHYARASKLNMSQYDRDTNRQFKKRPEAPSVATIISLLKAGNLLKKSPLSVPFSRHVSLNFWNVFLVTVSTILLKPTTCLVDSKSSFVKDRAVKIRIVQAIEDGFQHCSMKRSVLTLLHFDTVSIRHTIRFGKKNCCSTC